jgi:hypothetical protein
MRRRWVLACASVAAGLLLGPVPAAHAAVAPELYGVGSGDHPADGPGLGAGLLRHRHHVLLCPTSTHLVSSGREDYVDVT